MSEELFPVIGLGSVDLSVELKDIFTLGYKNAYRYFDTSDDYANETEFGYVVSDFKEKIIISTKISYPSHIFSLKTHFEYQLKKIGKIDIYLLHWPYPFVWKKIYKAMEELVLCGYVPHIGVCNFTHKKIKELSSFARIKPYILHTEISPLYQQREVVKFCNDNKIHIVNYSPLAHNHDKIVQNKNLLCIARKYNQTVQNIILRWSIQKGFTPLVKTTKEEHLISMNPKNLFSFSLEQKEIELIDSLDCNIKIWPKPERRFSLKCIIKCFLIHLVT